MKRILLCLMVALFATGCLFAKNNDEKMNVTLDAQGMMAARQATTSNLMFAAR